jgi:hypothetical protein
LAKSKTGRVIALRWLAGGSGARGLARRKEHSFNAECKISNAELETAWRKELGGNGEASCRAAADSNIDITMILDTRLQS